MMPAMATLKYDYNSASWVAVADWNDRLYSHGTTPQEAVDNLASECIRHNLWPK